MNDQEIMRTEISRVRATVEDTMAQVEAEGGDVRSFAAAFMTAAIHLHAEVEGVEGLKRALSRLAVEQLSSDNRAGRA